MDPFGIEFGKTLGQLVGEYRTAFAAVALVWHLSTVGVVCLVVRYGNRYRRIFAAYFTLNYVWLVAFVGIWMSVQLYARMGTVALAVYAATPVFLLIILYQWVQELRAPRLDLDFRGIQKWRLLIAVPMLVWGFWYPPYIFGVRLVWDPAELLVGAYGLMGCPTTMVALSLLFLKYPAGNRRLFHLLTGYAIFVGAAMVALLYVPDIPFFLLGLASLALIAAARRHDRNAHRSVGRHDAQDDSTDRRAAPRRLSSDSPLTPRSLTMPFTGSSAIQACRVGVSGRAGVSGNTRVGLISGLPAVDRPSGPVTEDDRPWRARHRRRNVRVGG